MLTLSILRHKLNMLHMPAIFSVGEGMDEGRKGLPRTRMMMPNIFVLIHMHIRICLCGMCIIIFPPKIQINMLPNN